MAPALAAAASAAPSRSPRPSSAPGRPVTRAASRPTRHRRCQTSTAASERDENAASSLDSARGGGESSSSSTPTPPMPPLPPLPPTPLPADPEGIRPWWRRLLSGGSPARRSPSSSIYRLMDALDTAPRVRTRTAGDRKIDQLADLAVLNARLAPPGAPDTPDPTEVRKRLEFLRTRRALWARVYEAVTRRDVAATLAVIEAATAEVGVALGDRADGRVGVGELSARLAGLRGDVAAARARLAASSAALAASASRLAALRADADALEAALARGQAWADAGEGRRAMGEPSPSTSASLASSPDALWWPVAFSASVRPGALAAFDLSGDPWVLFRPHFHDGSAGVGGSTPSPLPPISCLLDECAHRACPLSLGRVTPGGAAECPYHGWTFSGGGALVTAPSTRARPRGVRVPALPVVEADGLVWAWRPPGGAAALRVVAAAAAAATVEAGSATSAEAAAAAAASTLPPLLPPGPPPDLAATPAGFLVVAEAVAESTDPPAAVLARLAAGRAALASEDGATSAGGRLVLGTVLAGDGGGSALAAPPTAAQAGCGVVITTAGPETGASPSRRPLRLLHAVSPAGGPANPSGSRVLLRVCVSESVPWLARAGPGVEGAWARLAEDGVRADAGPAVSGGVVEAGVARIAGQ